MADTRNMLILGSGPAGYTAALYAARARLRAAGPEGPGAGGQLMLTTEVENYPGFADGILGPELMEQMEKQAERFEAELLHQDATGSTSPSARSASGPATRVPRARLIIATGAWRWLGVPGEETLRGPRRVRLRHVRRLLLPGPELLVVGGGDSAMEEATFLTKFASKVTIVHRRDELRASKIMHRPCARTTRRSRSAGTPPSRRSSATRRVTGVAAAGHGDRRHRGGRDRRRVRRDRPHAQHHAVRGQLDLEDGYIPVQEPRTLTSVPGVFAAGDVVDRIYRQAVTAAGMGCKAAMDAERFLGRPGHPPLRESRRHRVR